MEKLLITEDLSKNFVKGGKTIKAVEKVNLALDYGQTIGLVGESGCGKSTTGRLILDLITPSEGKVYFEGKNIYELDKNEKLSFRRNAQIIFQDCFASLSPRIKVGDAIVEVLSIHNIGKDKKDRTNIAKQVFESVGLSEEQMSRYPHEFSGGQRQRIGIARAMCLNPKMIICDEPVSALDVSVQAQIINLMQKLQKENNVAYIFISHDLSVVKHISDSIAVMYLGQIVETAGKKEFYDNPVHPYSQALLSAIPIPDPTLHREKNLLSSEANLKDYGLGCRFASRCWRAKKECYEAIPTLKSIGNNHCVACHFAKK